MKKIQVFLVLGFLVTLSLCIGFFTQKENERKGRMEAEKMLISAIEEKARFEIALKEQLRGKEKKIRYLFGQLDKERKINSRLMANIKRRDSRLDVASSDKKVVELEEIVITSLPEIKGRVLAVDDENNIVVVNLGSADSAKLGDRFSVYRENDFVADIELIKIQNRLSAATVVPTGKDVKVAINDSVRIF